MIPNNAASKYVWNWELKPQGFAILAYLCYLHTHRKNLAVPGSDEIAVQLHMSVDIVAVLKSMREGGVITLAEYERAKRYYQKLTGSDLVIAD